MAMGTANSTSTQQDAAQGNAAETGLPMDRLKQRLAPLYARLSVHPLYRSFRSVEDLRVFMRSHVYAVWDFMSLLKTLQAGLTCVATPWVPTADASSRRLVNEIVLGEESDEYDGRPVSHFELYLEAMEAAGAPTAEIRGVVEAIASGISVDAALAAAEAPVAARQFVEETFRVIGTGQMHAVAAAFTFGREDLIPDMFRDFIRDQDATLQGGLALFRWYLDRHIEVDGDVHGPLALRMVANLCGQDTLKWNEATDAAASAVEARLALWDGILAEIERPNAGETAALQP